MNTDKLLKMLLEAIDYSFWNPMDKAYDKELTWPVIDKVKYIKGLIKEEPVSEDLEKASKEWLAPQLDISYAAYGETKQMELIYFDGYAMLDAIEFGAKWKEEQFEKNRLAACDRQTEEEAEIERDFVIGIIEKEHRQPTFDDAIKYGMRLNKEKMMKDAMNAKVYNKAYPTEFEIETNTFMQKLKHGDNVKLIIIKED